MHAGLIQLHQIKPWGNGPPAPSNTHQGELVGHPAVRGQLGSKAQCREHLITVIVLDDLPHGLQGHGVGVHLVGVHVVERGGLRRVTCEDNGVSQAEGC